MRIIIPLLVLFTPFFNIAQNCDCESNFNWVKKTFEENDAGFSIAIERKGQQAYQDHSDTFLKSIEGITNSTECTQALYEWLTFFRSGHIAIRRLNIENIAESKKEPNEHDIIEQFKDWERLDIDLDEFREYLKTKNKIDFEGILQTGNYTIGVKKVGGEFIGFIIDADGVYWTKGQVKFRIKDQNTAIYYMGDHGERSYDDVELFGDNHLQMGAGFISLQRVFPELEDSPEITSYLSTINAQTPYLEEIDNSTLLLRIPSFSSSEKILIDSVINANRSQILSTSNLIIDLRNNGGGSDISFQELIPIIYTNPVRSVGVEYFSTKLNNQRMLDFINDPNFNFSDEDKIWAQESYDVLSQQLGQFVNLDSAVVEVIRLDTVYQFPKNVGILINENNGSTTEEFLLFAKQSRKVKLFGTTTYGVLDVSNMHFVESPCGDFELGYCLSRSLRLPDFTIDEKGIQPDYYIDRSIPKYNWIEYVVGILNEY